MAVQCGTVTVLYFVTVYISVFDVMAAQFGTASVLYFVTVYISVFDVMSMQCGTVTVLYIVTVYISVFDFMAVQCGTVTVLYFVTVLYRYLMFLYHLNKYPCHQLSSPMYQYLWVLRTELLIARISVKYNWQPNVSETKWEFDLTIYLSVHITFLKTVVAYCSLYPILQLPSRCSLLVPTVLLLLHSDLLKTFCIVMC